MVAICVIGGGLGARDVSLWPRVVVGMRRRGMQVSDVHRTAEAGRWGMGDG